MKIAKKLQDAIDNYDYETFYRGVENRVAKFNKEIVRTYTWQIAKGMKEANDYDAAITLASTGAWAKDVDLFVSLLEEIKQAFDNGHPFRQYGAAAVTTIVNYTNATEELLTLFEESYYLGKIDFCMDYVASNRAANKAEADYIDAQGPNYCHN